MWTVVLEPAYFNSKNYDDPEAARCKVLRDWLPFWIWTRRSSLRKDSGKFLLRLFEWRVETSIRDEINQFLEDNELSAGVRLIEDYKRYYPYGTVASTVLGFTGTDGQGLEGLELQYDTELSGTAGRLISAQNALGTDMP